MTENKSVTENKDIALLRGKNVFTSKHFGSHWKYRKRHLSISLIQAEADQMLVFSLASGCLEVHAAAMYAHDSSSAFFKVMLKATGFHFYLY